MWNGDFNGILNYQFIALKKEEVDKMLLPPSEVPYPWDNAKGIYILEAHHSLHCLQLIYRAIHNYRNLKEQIVSHQHIVHCLDNLRQNVICTADDTPLYATRNGTHSGENQVRMCRDLDQLNQWSLEREACYKYIETSGPDMAEIERYKYCKKDGKDMDKVRRFFGFDISWQPFPYRAQKEYMTNQKLNEKISGMSDIEKQEFDIA